MYSEAVKMRAFCESLLKDLKNAENDFDLACIEGTLEAKIDICNMELDIIKETTVIKCGSYFNGVKS